MYSDMISLYWGIEKKYPRLIGKMPVLKFNNLLSDISGEMSSSNDDKDVHVTASCTLPGNTSLDDVSRKKGDMFLDIKVELFTYREKFPNETHHERLYLGRCLSIADKARFEVEVHFDRNDLAEALYGRMN